MPELKTMKKILNLCYGKVGAEMPADIVLLIDKLVDLEPSDVTPVPCIEHTATGVQYGQEDLKVR